MAFSSPSLFKSVISESLPDHMHAVELLSYDEKSPNIRITQKVIPRLLANQVLVKVAAAPINPSDLMFMKGLYGLKKELPVVPGFECAGTVVAVGEGVIAKLLLGRRVACVGSDKGDGTWSQYVVTDALRCFPLTSKVNDEQGAMMIVNPLTAWALVDRVRTEGHAAFAQTAAASALGRMMITLSKRARLPLVNIVRRDDQARLLREQGADEVLVSAHPDFHEQLKASFKRLNVTLAYDAVGGALTADLIGAIRPKGTVVVYGGLSMENCQVSSSDLIFKGKRLEGFWLSSLFEPRKLPKLLRAAYEVQKHLLQNEAVSVQAKFPFQDAVKAIAMYESDMTKGKVLLQ